MSKSDVLLDVSKLHDSTLRQFDFVACSSADRDDDNLTTELRFGLVAHRPSSTVHTSRHLATALTGNWICVDVASRCSLEACRHRDLRVPNIKSSGSAVVFTARRYAKRGICRRHVSVCLSVCLYVCVPNGCKSPLKGAWLCSRDPFLVCTAVELESILLATPRAAINKCTHDGLCWSHLRRLRPPTLRLRPKLHRFVFSPFLLQTCLFNI